MKLAIPTVKRLFPVVVTAVLVVIYLFSHAAASSDGRSGYSGNPATNGGQTCATCHSGGTLPTVLINGPAVVDAGSTHNYTVTISGGPAQTAGFNVSLSNNAGTLVPLDGSAVLIGSEIAHGSPKPFSGGSANFSFNWTAPAADGVVTMYAAGNATNDSGGPGGDGVAAAALAITVQNGVAVVPTPTPAPPPAAIALQPVADSLTQPVVVTHAMDQRLFVVEQPGRIRVLEEDGSLLAAPFLDITTRVHNQYNEQGLLGLAFHPDYAANGAFFVYYTYESAGGTSVRSRLSRFTVSVDPNLADAGSEEILLEFTQPFRNHNAGDIQFGPDGYLYIASGDGGGSFWSSRPPENGGVPPDQYGQDPLELLGKVLRLDVDGRGGSDCDLTGSDAYAIPSGNAYTDGLGGAGCDEIWATGLRNPWRIGFDRATGDLWISDVGQNLWEEVNHVPAFAPGGANFGFSCFEGNHSTADNYDYFVDIGCQDAAAYDAPVFESSHSSGDCSITGGFVYRGADYLDLPGSYFFTDYCRPAVRTLTGDLPNGLTETEVLPEGQINTVSTFGQDARGELYVASRAAGTVSRILGSTPAPSAVTVFRAGSAPFIDGNRDAIWGTAQPHRITRPLPDNAPLFERDLHGRFHTLYDDTHLYLLVEVSDDVLINDQGAWDQDDAIVLYLDGDNSRGDTCAPGEAPPPCYDGQNDFELAFRPGDTAPTAGPNSAPVPTGSQFVLNTVPGGYLLEAAFPLSALGLGNATGTSFGLDVHLIDDDNSGGRERKLAWFSRTDDASLYPQRFGTATLYTIPTAVTLHGPQAAAAIPWPWLLAALLLGAGSMATAVGSSRKPPTPGTKM